MCCDCVGTIMLRLSVAIRIPVEKVCHNIWYTSNCSLAFRFVSGVTPCCELSGHKRHKSLNSLFLLSIHSLFLRNFYSRGKVWVIHSGKTSRLCHNNAIHESILKCKRCRSTLFPGQTLPGIDLDLVWTTGFRGTIRVQQTLTYCQGTEMNYSMAQCISAAHVHSL